MGAISISEGNIKMGGIKSVSLPAVATCIKCECNAKCYANKMEKRWKNVREAYEKNLNILNIDSDTYWREVEAAIMTSRFFRFHVSGDMPNREYLNRMVDVAKRNSHCEILCFTKKYDFVNDYLREGNAIPENLHMVLSCWRGLEMENPFNLPEAHVRYRDGSTTAREDAVECGGNCTEFATTDAGCWVLKNGEQVVFNEH